MHADTAFAALYMSEAEAWLTAGYGLVVSWFTRERGAEGLEKRFFKVRGKHCKTNTTAHDHGQIASLTIEHLFYKMMA